MGKTIYICELCAATIPDEWNNEHHYGTCPTCKRGTNFIMQNKELQNIVDEENKKKQKQSLLNRYNVYEKNTRSGIIHINCISLAKLIYNECDYYFKTIEDEDTGNQEIYYYYDGYYHVGGDNRIREIVDDMLEDQSSIHHKNEVVDYIKHRNTVNRERLEPPVHLINMKNGIYNLVSGKLEKHSPEFFFLNQIPVEYHEDARCPQIEKFLSEVLYKEYVRVVQEMIGYCMYRNYKYHKAFLLYGGGSNGKSTLQSLIQAFLGKHNYSTRELSSLLDNRFSSSDLYGKLANFGSELSGKALLDTSQFKHLTGGDSISAEKKFYGGFNFKNYSKLIFNTNNIPYSKYDKSLAYFRRWIIIVFPKTFEADDNGTDPDILSKLITKEELEGLMILALDGLKRLISQKRFSYDDSGEDTVGERYELLTKPDMQFIKDHLMVDMDNKVSVDEVYDIYWKWADSRGYPILVKKVFSRSMKKYMVDTDNRMVCDVQVTSRDGRSMRIYTNVCWKDKPSNVVCIDSFSSRIDGGAPTDIHNAIVKIGKNKDAGYSIDEVWLRNNFSENFISRLLEAGLLVHLPNGCYDIKYSG